MDTVLIILGVLGLGAIVIAAYVFTIAARKYVSNGNNRDRRGGAALAKNSPHINRIDTDRRQQSTVQSFPITVNGVLIEEDRRHRPDRRLAA
jgi:hypothetical protein